jgi:histidyl-tRNA synthetase
MEKPSLPKGTRDFGPVVMAKRQFILDSIKKVFQKYGFQPLETPAMENLSTLTGKYGDEGDQLLFRVLNSGEVEITELVNVKDFILDQLTYFTKDHRSKYDNDHDNFYLKIESELTDHFLPEKLKSYLNRNPLTIREKEIGTSFLTDKVNLKRLSFSLYKFYLDADIWSYDPIRNPNFDIEGKFTQYRKNSYNKEITKLLYPLITEKGLRYDLTVPFARYVVMNRGDITFPFKRYQIQPVWRADRPQKGRYREFYQCDADVVGTDSLICEAEIILMIKEVFKSLKISDYSIKINHRGVLSGLAAIVGSLDKQYDLFTAIDKLDKIGELKVREELIGKGFSDSSLNTLFEVLNYSGSNKIAYLTEKFIGSEVGNKGISDLNEVFNIVKDYGSNHDHIDFDIALARGLSYYTGCIFEVKINNVAIGSVSGGGRYDNLTQAFGAKERLSGVGISFGVDRLFDAMEELKLFPEEAQISSTVLITHFDSKSQRYGLRVLQTLRSNNVAAEIYPDAIKIQKQLDYANKKMIPYVIVIGSEEVKSGLLAFKNMKTGTQEKISIESITDYLR